VLLCQFHDCEFLRCSEIGIYFIYCMGIFPTADTQQDSKVIYVLQSDQKVSLHLMITIQHTYFLPHYLVQSDCLAADRQGQEDTRLTLTPSVIHNSNYVIMVSD
jgi:hypothetical protein